MSQQSAVDSAIGAAIQAAGDADGPLLPVLHVVQDRLGYIPSQSIPVIAKALNLSRAEVHGVVSFYHDFRSTPPGRHVVRICLAEACRATGAMRLYDHARRSLQIDSHASTADGTITLEPVYCLGNCACTPSMMVDDDVHGRVTPERFDAVAARLRETR